MELDLRSLLGIARRWWWLLLILPVLGAGSAYVASSRQVPLYSATATIRINPPAGSITDPSAVRLSQDLGETYRQLIVTSPVLDRVVTALDLPYDSQELATRTSAQVVSGTQLVRISVSDPDPDQAALIANTIATEFATYVTEEALNLINSTVVSLTEQTSALEQQIADIDIQIETLDIPENEQDAAIQAELDSLRLQRSQLQQQIVNLQTQTQALAVGITAAQTQVTVSEPARPPAAPYSPNTRRDVALGLFVGLMIATGLIAILEYLDNTVKSESNVPELAGAPMLATISTVGGMSPGPHQVFVITKPNSPAAESIRLLRANLQFAAASTDLKSLLITSAGPGEGKSTIVANLAVTAAQAGANTLIIDADMRKPTQHRIFGVPNDAGLSTALSGLDKGWHQSIHKVATPNLSLLTSGPTPPNPAGLLSLGAFEFILQQLAPEFDLIVVDTPPVRAVSDPILIARHTDGVVLLAQVGKTRSETLRRAVDALTQSGAQPIGVVLNKAKDNEGAGYHYYYESTRKSLKGTRA